MSTIVKDTVHGGSPNLKPEQWVPFEWEEPGLGGQVQGEVAVIRTGGTSGSLQAGFWRTGPTSPGAGIDGAHRLVYSSPLGDETAVVLEGSAVITVKSTGKSYEVEAGSVISHPKGLEVTWDIRGPYFRKYWVIWNGSESAPDAPQDFLVTTIHDNPDQWTDYHFDEPREGPQVAGELFFIRQSGSTGTFLSGIWRSGKSIAGTNVDEKGTLTTPYTGTLGDETILLLEGTVEVIETETGKRHHFQAGDVIGLSSGQHVTWISKGPFTKKLWTISKDQLPQ